MSYFLEAIKSITEIPSDQEEKFSSLISIRTIKKEESYIRAGQFPQSIGFVIQGLFRYFYVNEQDEELTKGFFPENTILSSYSAIVEQRESYFTIQALEDSQIEVVDYLKFKALFEQDPCWNRFLVKVLEKAFVKKEEREREFLLLSAKERYRNFLLHYPNLEERVKQSMVASYLGIAPESLSRIRKKS